jgi:hypothetical protein
MEPAQDQNNDDNADPALAEAKRLWMDSHSDAMNYATNNYVRTQTNKVLARWDEFRILYGVNSIMQVITDQFYDFRPFGQIWRSSLFLVDQLHQRSEG